MATTIDDADSNDDDKWMNGWSDDWMIFLGSKEGPASGRKYIPLYILRYRLRYVVQFAKSLVVFLLLTTAAVFLSPGLYTSLHTTPGRPGFGKPGRPNARGTMAGCAAALWILRYV